jgi:hypothetical protein
MFFKVCYIIASRVGIVQGGSDTVGMMFVLAVMRTQLLHTSLWKNYVERQSNIREDVLSLINPLMLELNPSTQRCLTRFFTGKFAS